MAITIRASGSGNDYKTTTQLNIGVVARANISVGDWLLVSIAVDSDATPTVVHLHDGANGQDLSHNVHVTATNSGNTVCAILSAKVTALPAGTGSIYVYVYGLDSGEAKAGSFYVVSGLDDNPFDKSNTGTGSGQTTHVTGSTGTLSQANEIVIGAVGSEHKGTEAAGSWTTGTGYVSGNELTSGTASNGSAANQTIRTAAEIVSATTAQVAEITSEGSSDYAACIATFKEAVTGVTVTPAAALGTQAIQSPAVVLGSTSATPGAALGTQAIQLPTVVLGSTTATPGVALGTAAPQDPGVVESDIYVTPGNALSTQAIQDPAVVLGSTSSTPGNALATAAPQNPVVVLGSVTFTPAVALGTAAPQSPSVIHGSLDITPGAALGTQAIQSPAVHLGSTTATPAAANATQAIQIPVVVMSSMNVTPAVALGTQAIQDPGVVVGGDVLVTPGVALGTDASQSPTVIHGSIIMTPAEALGTSAIQSPLVHLGSTSIAPAAALGTDATQDPVAIAGSITLTPAVSLGTVDPQSPVVVLGSTTVTPGVALATDASQDPAVMAGGDVFVTPAAAAAIAAAIDPAVEGGAGGYIFKWLAMNLPQTYGVGGWRVEAIPVPVWYDPDNEGLDVYAAYSPEGATSLADSYVDESDNGHNAYTGTAPDWDATNGWKFIPANLDNLRTDFIPQNDQSQTVIIKYSNLVTDASIHYMFGMFQTGIGGFAVGITTTSQNDYRLYNSTTGQEPYGIATEGIIAVAGNKAYLDGADMGVTFGSWSGTPANKCYIGCMNSNGSVSGRCSVYIKKLAIYNQVLTQAQVQAVTDAM